MSKDAKSESELEWHELWEKLCRQAAADNGLTYNELTWRLERGDIALQVSMTFKKDTA